jgi:hypothetical protein
MIDTIYNHQCPKRANKKPQEKKTSFKHTYAQLKNKPNIISFLRICIGYVLSKKPEIKKHEVQLVQKPSKGFLTCQNQKQ